MVTTHTTKAILARGMKHGGKGMALAIPLAVTVWLAVGQRMEQQDALIRAQTAEISALNAKLTTVAEKVRDQAEFDERLRGIEADVRSLAAAVYGQAVRDQADWRIAHCSWLRKEGLDVPVGMCDAGEHEQPRIREPEPRTRARESLRRQPRAAGAR